MKKVLLLALFACCCFAVGCEKEAASVVDGADKDDIAEYRRLQAESEKAAEAGAAAASENEKSQPRG